MKMLWILAILLSLLPAQVFADWDWGGTGGSPGGGSDDGGYGMCYDWWCY